MIRHNLIMVVVTISVLGLGACGGNSDEDCRSACDWWAQYCTSASAQSCIDDCKDSDESAVEAVDRCVEGSGWSTPSTCQSAGCCLRWVYDDYSSRC